MKGTKDNGMRGGMRLRAAITAVTAAAMLAGCATTGPGPAQRAPGPLPPSTRPAYNLSGYPPAARDGYIDGCETAKRSRYGFKDEKRFAADSQYRMGWKDGFDLCRNKR